MSSSRHHNVWNRLKEMCGEAGPMRALHPDAVLGYLLLIDASAPGRIAGRLSHHTNLTIAAAVGARCGDVARFPHHFDVGCVLRVNLETGTCKALHAPGLRTYADFLDELVRLWTMRQANRDRAGRRRPRAA
jgi:hypothetical protein